MKIALFGISFEHPLWMLASLVAVSCIGILVLMRIRRQKKLAEDPFWKMHGVARYTPSPSSLLLRSGLLLSGLLLLGIAASDPYRIAREEVPLWSPFRLTVLFDVSLSMKYAHDTPPFEDRLAAAKTLIASVAGDLENSHASYALIPFAGQAVELLPYTSDASEFSIMLDRTDERTVAVRGTSIAASLRAYLDLASSVPAPPGTQEIVLLVSDGGKGDGIEQERAEISGILAKLPSNVTVISVGLGSVREVALPGGLTGRTPIPVELYVTDENGQKKPLPTEGSATQTDSAATSEIDEPLLSFVSSGRYHHFDDIERTREAVKKEISARMTKIGTEEKTHSIAIAHWFAITAFFLIISAFFLPRSRRKKKTGRGHPH